MQAETAVQNDLEPMTMADTPNGRETRRKISLKRWVPIGIIAAALATAYALGLNDYISVQTLSDNREALQNFVAQNMLLAALSYMAVYIIAVALSFPGASFLTIASGFSFGWLLGGALTAVSATIGATIIFLAARTAFGDLLQRKAGDRILKLRDGFQEDSFNYLLFLRLAPIFPFWLINLAPALFGMRLGPYVLATFVGILPGTFAYAYFGQGISSAIDMEGSVVSPELLIGLGALGLASLLPVVLKRIRRSRRAAG
ncbi:MAG: TVP38/TMEM64 family protein [Hyphomicrobiales bacterium]|nr:TVP38/TMEM64 family protein [Hyphomicrobiales bacterium]